MPVIKQGGHIARVVIRRGYTVFDFNLFKIFRVEFL